MDCQRDTFNGINLFFIQASHFKRAKISLSFRTPIKKSDITINKFLTRSLLYSTKRYKTQRLFLIEQQKLYNLSLNWDTYRRGNYLFSDFNLSCLNDEYTEAGNLEKGMVLLLDAIFNPNVTSRAFDGEIFDIIYSRMKEDIETLKENKNLYATIRMKQLMGATTPYSYVMNGYLEDLDKITPSTLYRYHQRWLKNSMLDIFVAGDIDAIKMKSLLQSIVPIKIKYNSPVSIFYEHPKLTKKTKKHFESDDIVQGKIVIGCKLTNLTVYERQYVLPIYDIVFGSTPTSKLFAVVREKHSLCYSINSTLDVSSNIMYINAGINKEQYSKTVKLIKKLMLEMENGIIDEEKFNDAKTLLVENNKAIKDELGSLINRCQVEHLFCYDDVETASNKIKNVSLDEVVAVSKKVKLNTIFLLHGGEIHEGN